MRSFEQQEANIQMAAGTLAGMSLTRKQVAVPLNDPLSCSNRHLRMVHLNRIRKKDAEGVSKRRRQKPYSARAVGHLEPAAVVFPSLLLLPSHR